MLLSRLGSISLMERLDFSETKSPLGYVDGASAALRIQLCHLIPLSEIGKGKLTVGKIYGGLLILENWKASKFGNIPVQKVSAFGFHFAKQAL